MPRHAHTRRCTHTHPPRIRCACPCQAATQRAPGVGVSVSRLRGTLAAARGLARPSQLDDLEALACFSFMGNDYLPPLKEGSFERLWRTLCALRRHPQLAGERLLRPERAFNPSMLRCLLLIVGRVYRGASVLIARDIDAGVAPAEARRRHALVGLQPEELSPLVEAVVADVYALGADAAGAGAGAGRRADVIRVQAPRGAAGASGRGGRAERGERAAPKFDNAAQYLGGVLWTLAMYTDGVPSDYAFVCEARPTPLQQYLIRAVPTREHAIRAVTACPSPPSAGHQRTRVLDAGQVHPGM